MHNLHERKVSLVREHQIKKIMERGWERRPAERIFTANQRLKILSREMINNHFAEDFEKAVKQDFWWRNQ